MLHIVFSIFVFIFVGLFETFRNGIFGLNSTELMAVTAGILGLCAFAILRMDIPFIIRRPQRALYGQSHLGWTWARTCLGLLLGVLLWVIPATVDPVQFQTEALTQLTPTLLTALGFQVLLVALPQELFFREAAIKAFRGDPNTVYLLSGLAYFIFFVPFGIPTALVMAGAGVYFMTLRLIGTNILAIALIHGTTNLVMTKGVTLGLTGNEEWLYAAYFLTTSLALSAVTLRLFAQKPSEYSYA